jgi:hypothetical protein
VEPREKLIADLADIGEEIFAGKSPFYFELMKRMQEDVGACGPCWDLLEPFAAEPQTEFFPLRALAGVHRMVLDGSAPELVPYYPSVGGNGDGAAAWPGVRAALASHSPEVVADLRHPLQTNETSRCGALASGFHVIAAGCELPIRALELGSSAGLNLHFDRYRYEGGGLASGPEDSPVRFIDYWRGGVPPLATKVEVAERRGCDLDPIDAGSEEGRIELLSYVMPDELARIEQMRGALAVAATYPVSVDRASADDWIAERLSEPATAMATVVFHSIFWIYPPADVTGRIAAAIAAAGERASAEAPFFWLRYEESAERIGTVELRLTSWPGGEEQLLATGGHHYEPLQWLAPSAA